MKRSLYYLSLLLLIVALAGCGRGNRRPGRGGISILTPTSSGSAYEMLVVIDNDMWERPAGRALFEVLDSDVPGLPQPERSFRIMHTAPRNYDATMKLVRNIIVVDIQNIYTQGKFRLSKDVFSTGGTDGGEQPVRSQIVAEGKHTFCIRAFQIHSGDGMKTNQVYPAIKPPQQLEQLFGINRRIVDALEENILKRQTALLAKIVILQHYLEYSK